MKGKPILQCQLKLYKTKIPKNPIFSVRNEELFFKSCIAETATGGAL